MNDTHGHATGDALVVAVAARLSALVRPGDTLARVSGDEFVLVFDDVRDATDADVLVTRLHEASRTPFSVTGVELSVTASIGVAHAGPGHVVPDQLMAAADAEMYQAKRRRGEPDRHAVALDVPVAG